MATTAGSIDVDQITQTLSALGWSHQDGTLLDGHEMYGLWHDLWLALGNVGDSASHQHSERNLSAAARILVHDVLFEEVTPDQLLRQRSRI